MNPLALLALGGPLAMSGGALGLGSTLASAAGPSMDFLTGAASALNLAGKLIPNKQAKNTLALAGMGFGLAANKGNLASPMVQEPWARLMASTAEQGPQQANASITGPASPRGTVLQNARPYVPTTDRLRTLGYY